jgi:hypothetical protein
VSHALLKPETGLVQHQHLPGRGLASKHAAGGIQALGVQVVRQHGLRLDDPDVGGVGHEGVHVHLGGVEAVGEAVVEVGGEGDGGGSGVLLEVVGVSGGDVVVEGGAGGEQEDRNRDKYFSFQSLPRIE